MKTPQFFIVFALILATCWTAAAADSNVHLANPNASPEARGVMEYLNSIRNEKTLSGQHVMYGQMMDRDLGHILQTTGKYPALIEFEGGIFARKFDDAYTSVQEQLVKDAIAYWKAGGLVAICWHWGNPMEPQNTYPNTKIPFDIEAALREGTPEHEAMMKDLDVTATMQSELRDAHVPVLWRPLHEICGGWFWWGMQGKDTGQKLWKTIFTYYTEHHHLDNLIWVYSASQEMRTEWFPGIEFADVIGVDIYRKGQQGQRRNFDRMSSVAGNQPVALTECDAIPDPATMKEQGFLWAWFSTWHSRYLRGNSPELLRSVYNHELVITRDELPVLNHTP